MAQKSRGDKMNPQIRKAIAQTYTQHQEPIDKVIETAFQNIHWIGLPDDYLSRVEGTKLVYPKDVNHIHLRVGIREVTVNPENRLFGWFIMSYIANKHTGKLVVQSRWTRRDLQYLKILSQAMLFGTGKGDLQFEIKSNALQGYKPCSEEDIEIINEAWEEHTSSIKNKWEEGIVSRTALINIIEDAEKEGFVADCIVENSIDGTHLPQDIQKTNRNL